MFRPGCLQMEFIEMAMGWSWRYRTDEQPPAESGVLAIRFPLTDGHHGMAIPETRSWGSNRSNRCRRKDTMISRRTFLETLGAGSATLVLSPSSIFGGIRSRTSSHFRVHPFVEAHPNAVFIMRTNVDAKTDSAAVKQAGLAFGQSVFVPSDSSGYSNFSSCGN